MNDPGPAAAQRGIAKTRHIPIKVLPAPASQARQMGFTHAACGPLVRSSHHADQQAHAAGI